VSNNTINTNSTVKSVPLPTNSSVTPSTDATTKSNFNKNDSLPPDQRNISTISKNMTTSNKVNEGKEDSKNKINEPKKDIDKTVEIKNTDVKKEELNKKVI